MKICNLAALDPDFLATGRVGLWGGISKLDREIYDEFSKDWEGLSMKAESIVGLPLFDLTEPVYNGDPHRKKSYAEIADKQARKFFRDDVLDTRILQAYGIEHAAWSFGDTRAGIAEAGVLGSAFKGERA